MAVEDRLRKHLTAHKGFTARAKDWAIVFQMAIPDKQLAFLKEKEIKRTGARRFLDRLNQ